MDKERKVECQGKPGSFRKIDCQGNLSSLTEAKRILKTAEHMAEVTYPVVKEGKMILKILDLIGKSINLSIEARGKGCKIDEDVREILDLVKQHQKSPMEFSRKEKVVIMQEDLNTQSITLADLKRYILTAKGLLESQKIAENYVEIG